MFDPRHELNPAVKKRKKKAQKRKKKKEKPGQVGKWGKTKEQVFTSTL